MVIFDRRDNERAHIHFVKRVSGYEIRLTDPDSSAPIRDALQSTCLGRKSDGQDVTAQLITRAFVRPKRAALCVLITYWTTCFDLESWSSPEHALLELL